MPRNIQFSVAPPATLSTYNPGHWVQFNSGTDSQATMQTALTAAPTVKGFLKRYYWFELETGATQGAATYTLTDLISDLNWCYARGKKFIPMLVDKTFDTDSTNGANPLPQYLTSKALVNTTGGYTALRWDSLVATRFRALIQAIKNQTSSLASYASLEGIATQETSLGLTTAQRDDNGYTAPIFAQYYIDLFAWMDGIMPTKRAFWFMNFIAGGQAQIDRVINECSVLDNFAAGGPDCWPTSGAGSGLRANTYPKYGTHETQCPLFCGASIPSYTDQPLTIGATVPPNLPMADVFEYARDELFVQYFFWMWRPTGANNFPTHSAAVIAANPTFNVEDWT
jgi:hypothetical protein